MALDQVPLEQQPEFDDVGPASSLDWAILAIARPFIWIYNLIVAPFHIRRTLAAPRVTPWTPLPEEDAARLPAAARRFLDASERAAIDAGFGEPLRYITTAMKPTVMCMTVLPGVDGEDLCVINVGHSPRRMTVTGVTFMTRATDGRLIETGNESFGGSASMPALHDVVLLENVQSVAQLADIHRRRREKRWGPDITIEHVGWRSRAVAPLAFFQRVTDERIEYGVSRGRIVRPATTEIRPTLKGAALSSWRLQWPMRVIGAWQRRRRAQRVLRELSVPARH